MKRIVIVGYGKIARLHRHALESVGFKVVASCNRTLKSNQMSLKDNIPVVYNDYHKMISQEKPDAILISVSSDFIFKVAKDIIPYSIPILLEKPSGNSVSEHKKLIQLTKKYKTKLMLGLNRRHYSIFDNIFNSIGGIKKITNVLIEWSEPPAKLINRGMSKNQISNIIFANSIHGIDLLCWLTGGIENPTIFYKNYGKFRWLMNISGVSKSGVIYNFNSSWDNPVPWRIVIYSKDKRFVMAPLEKLEILDSNWKKSYFEPKKPHNNFKAGFYNQAKTFYNLVSFNEKEYTSLHSATNSMEVCQILFDKFNVN